MPLTLQLPARNFAIVNFVDFTSTFHVDHNVDVDTYIGVKTRRE